MFLQGLQGDSPRIVYPFKGNSGVGNFMSYFKRLSRLKGL